ncbi:MAG TPA: excinuclease ABC subunit UvrA [Acidobacteriota bacterium]|nr:excinuclease ABC subunit UvrA [Acidobacteriota bacterium]
MKQIAIRGARQHNLKNIDLDLPRNSIVVVTGLSGSGKSSLAFDTVYAEGQRRYIESLSSYARQFLEQMEKPDVDSIEGLSPAISIEQKTTSRNARSTVGTITEIYDYFRLLFSSIGTPHCPNCDKPVARQTAAQIVDRIFDLPEAARIQILGPVIRGRKGEFRKLFEKFHKAGYIRARIDGEMHFLEDPPELNKRKNHTVEIVVDRVLVRSEDRPRIENSVRHALDMTQGLVAVDHLDGDETLYSEKQACVDCGINVPVFEPRSFSFNSRFGACPACDGLGVERQVNLDRLVEDPSKPCDKIELALNANDLHHLLRHTLPSLLDHFGLPSNAPFADLPAEVRKALRNGLDEPIKISYGKMKFESRFGGLNEWFDERLNSTSSEKRRKTLLDFMSDGDCRSCGGSRLRPESRAVRVNGLSIGEYTRMPLDACLKAVEKISLEGRREALAGQILEEISGRLRFMLNVGLTYLTLDRRASTLSGGESQRIRLATQVGSRLRGVLYVLDEPSIGLHPRDTRGLLRTLADLRDLGNTILVVEHDEETIRFADHVVDLGPGAGSHGGHVVAAGTVNELSQREGSLTGDYLSGRKQIPLPEDRRKGRSKLLKVMGARHNNLKDIDVAFPLGRLIAVTGVSGSGKSSLVDEVLYRALSRKLYKSVREPGQHREIRGLQHIDKVIEIDQAPIGRTPRSNPATYTGLFTPIRELYASLPESRMRGYKPGRFSFNVKGGRCESCQGDGKRKIEMNFLPDVYVDCESCQGKRYNRETLSIRYKGHSISDILEMTVEEAYPVLENIPRIQTRLKTLLDVGLGYLKLGQSATTISGGEAQRVKLSRELSKRSTGKTLYILDEPTTGLHFEDVRKLLQILHELVDYGNTVIVIEHNLEVVKSADWIIDLGPEGGEQGGRIVCQGTPAQVAKRKKSYTGQALRAMLS